MGNLHPAVQRERLKWLGRLASLSDRYSVQIHTGVFGKEYRDLLRRARIVFNRSIRGEANRRVFEAAAGGALLFQEEGNLETPQFFRDRQECIYYNGENLETLLEYYLEHEDERQVIAEAGQTRAAEYSFEKHWTQHLALIEGEWEMLLEAAAERITSKTEDRGLRIEDRAGWHALNEGKGVAICQGPPRPSKSPGVPPSPAFTTHQVATHHSPFTTHHSPNGHSRLTTHQAALSLYERTWQALCSSAEGDPGLASDVAAALVERPHDADLHHALGLMTALTEKGPGPVTSTLAQKVVGYFQRAFESDPGHIMAGLNLVEALVGLNQKDAAVAQAKRVLARFSIPSRMEDRRWRIESGASIDHSPMVRSQESGVSSQRSEVRRQRSEVREQSAVISYQLSAVRPARTYGLLTMDYGLPPCA